MLKTKIKLLCGALLVVERITAIAGVVHIYKKIERERRTAELQRRVSDAVINVQKDIVESLLDENEKLKKKLKKTESK